MLRVGFAERDITPPAGTPFGGFALERDQPAAGAHDRLMAVAMAVAGDDGSGVVVACDLQLVTADLVRAVREELQAELDLPPHAVLVHATHDHAAPGGDASETGLSGADPEFGPQPLLELVLGGIVGAAIEAHARLAPATLRLHTGRIPGIGRYRHDPDAPETAPAALLLAHAPDGTPVGALASYACHPSVLGPDNRLFTADFPGIVRQAIAADLDGAPVLYLNGPAGDLSTRHTRRAASFPELMRLGAALADQLWTLTAEPGREIAGEQFAAASRSIDLPLAPLPTEAELAAQLEAAEAAATDPAGDLPLRRARFAVERAARLRRLDGTVPVEIQALRLGDLRLLGIAGEPCAELGERLAEAVAVPLLIAAPANGSVGPIVPQELFGRVPTILAHGAAERLLWATIGFLQRREFA